MALDTASVLLLSAAKSIGADFSDALMVGRQQFGPRADALARIFTTFGIAEDAEAFLRNHKYADRFFELMGANRVESLDLSEFEGASRQHDLNRPLPAELRGKYSIVHDGGTLEHIFNIAQALKNCMEMVRPGGHFTQVSCANNLMGHGFWQLSPETIFRTFSAANGFEVKAVLLHELHGRRRWIAVTDPAVAASRVQLANAVPTYILTVAQRIGDRPAFATFPQQSDYVTRWERSERVVSRPGEKSSSGASPAARARKAPAALRKLQRLLSRRRDGLSAPYFREISEEDVMFGRFPRE